MRESVKLLFDVSEELTHTVLQPACERYGARVFAKPRVADVLNIQGSGIGGELSMLGLFPLPRLQSPEPLWLA